MSPLCLPYRMLTTLIVVAGLRAATAQTGNGLLLPFPEEAAAADSTAAPPAGVPMRERRTADTALRDQTDVRRAQELAETFIRRQQMEVTHSVPRRGEKKLRVPARSGSANGIAPPPIAASAMEPLALANAGFGSSGPASELLPLPGDDSPGMPLDIILPDAPEGLPAGGPVPDSESGSEVPRSDLAPAPAYGGVENQARSGPVFRISGAQAFAVARARGFKFTPAGGIGARDGAHTAAAQFPNTLTSEVHGTSMSQLRPPPAWSVTETSNTFFMFCDAHYNAVRLAPGWRIRGIKLTGPHWRWVACPRSGANTASFSIRVHSYKDQDRNTSVQLAGLTLEGPEGATDWRDAFPWINGKGPLRPAGPPGGPAQEQPVSESLAASPDKNGEPPLPQ